MNNLEPSQTENKDFHRCRQVQCSFFLNGGCQSCDDCKSEPYEIKKKCHRCFKCENIPNQLRWGNQKLLQVKVPVITPEQLLVVEPTSEEEQKKIILELQR